METRKSDIKKKTSQHLNEINLLKISIGNQKFKEVVWV